MNENTEMNVTLPVKWLRNLFFLKVITTILSVLVVFSQLVTTIAWINRAASVGIILALFQLTAANPHYRKAAILLCVTLGGGLVAAFSEQNLLTMAVSICSIIAAYHEFNAHSEVTASMDAKLSGKWHALFYWQMVVGIIAGFITTAGLTICTLAGIDSPVIIAIFLWSGTFLSVIIELFYLRYLKKTIALFDAD